MKRVTGIMRRLRAPDGCPWDREQTLESLREHLLEECYEVLDAMESGDAKKHKEELGDLLLQVVFQSQIRNEMGHFGFNDVAETLAEKLVHRHPHVFGKTRLKTSAEVLKSWEKIKAREKSKDINRSALSGIPRTLPALLKAQRSQAKAARVGFDWKDVRGVMDKIEEELREVKDALKNGDKAHLEHEIGDLMFAVVNLSRFKKISAEIAMDRAVARFARRFQGVEQRVESEGRHMSDCTLDELEAHWQVVKEEEKKPAKNPGRKTVRRDG